MKQVDDIINDYINAEDTDYAIMIDGQWGAGKSYYWENVLRKQIEETGIPRNSKNEKYKAAKISLFGIQSVDDLKLEIYTSLCNVDEKSKKKNFISFGSSLLKGLGDKLGLPIDKKLAANFLSLIPIDLSRRVLCFDDLERLNTDILKEVLGYINSLIEQHHQKVVFICNNVECKSSDYTSYKEKLIRFTCKLQTDIPAILETLMKDKEEKFKDFILLNKGWIGQVYKNAKCNNLRTLKFNMDIMERIYPDILANMGEPEWKVDNYVLLLTMVYSIESRLKANDLQLNYILDLTQSWANQVSYIDSIARSNSDWSDDKKVEDKKDPKEEYLREKRNKYFKNSFIYGTSKALLDYVCNGDFDQALFVCDVKKMTAEARRFNYTDEQKLMSKLSNFWDIDDEEMYSAIEEVIKGTTEMRYPMEYYPNFFLRLQRLQDLGFADTGCSIVELKRIFQYAIENCTKAGYNEQLNGIYQNADGATDEFKELTELVYALNYDQRNIKMGNEFEDAILHLNKNINLKQFWNIPINLFAEITAKDFFESFLKCHNSRKRDVCNFFKERYKVVEHQQLDTDFINRIVELLVDYLNSKARPAPSKKYCEYLLKMLPNSTKNTSDG